MIFPLVTNRSQLRSVLEKSLIITEEGKEDEEDTDKKPKTFIIESNLGENIQFHKETPLVINISDTKDKNLKILNIRSERAKADYYLDTNDKRFWILHSIDSSTISSMLINNLVNYNPSQLDFPWFSSNNLERISKLGKETGFSIKFINKFIKESDENYEDKLQNISMRFWGGHSFNVIGNLRKDPNVNQGISLSFIGLKYSTDIGFVNTNISSKGKFVAAKGDSIDSYFNLINRVKDNYKSFINLLEQNYRISYEKKENGFKLGGGFTLIEFEKEIEDLNSFIKVLTSCSSPFRLWGTWNEIEEKFIKIKGIDLHTTHKINIELTPNWMRIFLPKESCGNVIPRLYTNLQHFFDSKINLRGNDDEKFIY